MKSPRLIGVALLALLAACRHPSASGPLRQEAYVWQRSWNSAVQEAVRRTPGISGLVVLAAEVDPAQGSPRVARIPLEPSLKSSGKPIGVALRVTTFPSRFADEPAIGKLLAALIQDVILEAEAKRIALSEVQIDYDCPESKLDDFRGLLPLLRRATAPIPLTFTALPNWMGQRRAFAKLIAAADGYVLQVHSLTPPTSPKGDFSVLRAGEAREWVETAARFGRPFRVALPTYGYLAAFDSKGKLVGLSAEGPLLAWPAGLRLREARSDPAAAAGLVREWTRERPPELTGILWYRLPVEGDRLNWTFPTLRAVMTGRVPRGGVRVAVRAPEPGLVEVDLLNTGDGEAAAPSPVSIGWRDGSLLAADGLAGYQTAQDQGFVRLERRRPGRLRPGERRTIAWLRFAAPTEIHVELPKDPG
ncbi:MAG TPA: DUF3142 domain-containing protein [Thermoanaerobaculia bacterium]